MDDRPEAVVCSNCGHRYDWHYRNSADRGKSDPGILNRCDYPQAPPNLGKRCNCGIVSVIFADGKGFTSQCLKS